MLRKLALIVILGGVFSVHVWSQELPDKNQENNQPNSQQGKLPDARDQSGFRKFFRYIEEKQGDISNYVSDGGQNQAADHSLNYSKLGFLVSAFVAIITFFIAIAAFIQASAPKMAAYAVIHSERAWIVADIPIGPTNPAIPPNEGTLPVMAMCALKNKGKTPAFILEAGEAIAVTNDSEELPRTPPPYDQEKVMKWSGRGIPISPKSGFARYVFGTIQNPINIFRRSTVLWVYGYVRYRDVFSVGSVLRGRVHETRYCFKFIPAAPDVGMKAQFVIEGPTAYNRAT